MSYGKLYGDKLRKMASKAGADGVVSVMAADLLGAAEELGQIEDRYRSNIRNLFSIVGIEPEICAGENCHREIWKVWTKNDKRMPVTDEGLAHFADCPAAAKFRRPR